MLGRRPQFPAQRRGGCVLVIVAAHRNDWLAAAAGERPLIQVRRLAACSIDLLNQRLDRARAPSCVRPIPPLGSEARTGVSLCIFS